MTCPRNGSRRTVLYAINVASEVGATGNANGVAPDTGSGRLDLERFESTTSDALFYVQFRMSASSEALTSSRTTLLYALPCNSGVIYSTSRVRDAQLALFGRLFDHGRRCHGCGSSADNFFT